MVSNRTRALFLRFCEYGDLENTPVMEQFKVVSSKPDFDLNMVIEEKSGLCTAIARNQIRVVSFLLAQEKIDVNLGSPLTVAVKFERDVIMESLLNHPSTKIPEKFMQPDEYHGKTPVCVAAKKENLTLLNKLLQLPGVDLKIGTYNPVHFVCDSKTPNMEILQKLLAHPDVDVNNGRQERRPTSESPLAAACAGGHVQIVKLLLQHPSIQPTSHATQSNPLALACLLNNIEIIRLLLDQVEVDLNSTAKNRISRSYEEYSPLTAAINNNNLELVELLLANPKLTISKKCDHPAAKNLHPLLKAISLNAYPIIEVLLRVPGLLDNEVQRRILFPQQHEKPLDKTCFDMISKHPDFNVNRTNWSGETALQRAALRNDSSLCRELLLLGADAEIQHKDLSLRKHIDKILTDIKSDLAVEQKTFC